MLLCDHAVVAEGKLYINGGGWSITGPAPAPSALAIKVEVPWDRTNTPIPIVIRLIGEDGEPVLQDVDGSPVPVEVQAKFEVGRPPGLQPGSSIDLPIAINIPPLQLEPGRRFSWELSIDDEKREDWYLSFATRAHGARP